jgi:hypothetical protein
MQEFRCSGEASELGDGDEGSHLPKADIHS